MASKVSKLPGQPPSELAHKSKSQLKREARSVQELAERLVELTSSELAKIPLDVELQDAIEQARSIRSHPARRRQLKLVGKRLRASQVDDIRGALDRLRKKHDAAVRRLHEAEYWRDHLLAGNGQSLNEILALHPDADGQRLRQLVRAARKENSQGRPPAATRKLFRYLHELIKATPETF